MKVIKHGKRYKYQSVSLQCRFCGCCFLLEKTKNMNDATDLQFRAYAEGDETADKSGSYVCACPECYNPIFIKPKEIESLCFPDAIPEVPVWDAWTLIHKTA